jgi:hypothetical protein
VREALCWCCGGQAALYLALLRLIIRRPLASGLLVA